MKTLEKLNIQLKEINALINILESRIDTYTKQLELNSVYLENSKDTTKTNTLNKKIKKLELKRDECSFILKNAVKRSNLLKNKIKI